MMSNRRNNAILFFNTCRNHDEFWHHGLGHFAGIFDSGRKIKGKRSWEQQIIGKIITRIDVASVVGPLDFLLCLKHLDRTERETAVIPTSAD